MVKAISIQLFIACNSLPNGRNSEQNYANSKEEWMVRPLGARLQEIDREFLFFPPLRSIQFYSDLHETESQRSKSSIHLETLFVRAKMEEGGQK